MVKKVKSSKMKRNGLLVRKKRPRLQLSDLPMDVLHSIVSRLPIRQAVRTSVLSKHWKYVWRSCTNLEFSFKSLLYKKGSLIPRPSISEYVFIQRVNAVLEQHSGIVDKMKVYFAPLHNEHAEHIDRWVKFAIASKTKQLVLDFEFQYPEKEPYGFSFLLFDATTGFHLQSLKLGCICLKHTANIKFLLNLRKLALSDVNITDEELKVLLFNCKVLEFFEVSCCKMLTSLHTHHLINQLKHLHVSKCPLLQVIEINFGLTTLEYEGSLIPLAPPSTLRNMSIKSSNIRSALAYIFSRLPTLPYLEMLTLRCRELKRAVLPKKPIEFHSLRHIRLELNFVSLRKRRSDVLDLACLLVAAPFMETLEIHMWTDYELKRYHKCDGELRSLPSHDHSHLKLVNITGFYGQKDQLELALHILRSSTMLKAMKIDPRPTVASKTLSLRLEDGLCFVEGYKVARKYLCKVDNNGVVNVVKVRLRDVENVWPYKLIDPDWLDLVAEEEE